MGVNTIQRSSTGGQDLRVGDQFDGVATIRAVFYEPVDSGSLLNFPSELMPVVDALQEISGPFETDLNAELARTGEDVRVKIAKIKAQSPNRISKTSGPETLSWTYDIEVSYSGEIRENLGPIKAFTVGALCGAIIYAYLYNKFGDGSDFSLLDYSINKAGDLADRLADPVVKVGATASILAGIVVVGIYLAGR